MYLSNKDKNKKLYTSLFKKYFVPLFLITSITYSSYKILFSKKDHYSYNMHIICKNETKDSPKLESLLNNKQSNSFYYFLLGFSTGTLVGYLTSRRNTKRYYSLACKEYEKMKDILYNSKK